MTLKNTKNETVTVGVGSEVYDLTGYKWKKVTGLVGGKVEVEDERTGERVVRSRKELVAQE